MTTPYTQYISTNAPGVTMISAMQKQGAVINTTTHSITFYVSVVSTGDAEINRTRFTLRCVLCSANGNTEILVSPSSKEGATYRYKIKGQTAPTVSNGTIDTNEINHLEWIHGDLHFVIPKNASQTVVMCFVEFEHLGI
jgi:hypothetical protein